ncbi:MAG: energy-coupled thiamine transporter ThiT [Clostridiales bacterium]|nr:energy-coupled thiamine transporter ThiT [Clostridiales bacterium]
MFAERFSKFFMSTPGLITTCVVIVLLTLTFALNLRKSKKLSAKALTYAAICIALATVLSNVKLLHLPYGGTLTACSMVFISFIGFWFGSFAGITAAVAYGLLQLVLDPHVIHPVQILLDYPVAFGMLGISGFFANRKYGLYTGFVVGALGRALCSTLSGVIFFAEYAGEQNVWIYSTLYNLSYIVPEIILTVLLISIPPMKKAILQVKSSVAV